MVKGRTSMGRHVTFSKHHAGLFKIASELCTLTGAEVAVVTFSASGNAHSFGNPSVDSIVHRFFSENCPPMAEESVFSPIDGCRRANIEELTRQYSELIVQPKEEKKISKEPKRVGDKYDSTTPWWEAPIENLNLPQLQCLTNVLVDLKKRLIEQAMQMAAQDLDPSTLLPGSSIGAVDLPSTSQTTVNDALIGAPTCGSEFGSGLGHGPF